ncbi:undecaprenyldiphospho-muramoylpentapeptide beta-N-acetylglucosaminyltransferase [Immundisolibacter cernigliae]|uniref:UDP-N-acetylglucosamine--N-acetylmuramyl-(pentapeptide) pyrophosphoryl-undecaprenol N-acetylglucosamine transferase n=1 Tax=Immundisolibacter cernigliae TaxID=1810504 RepID=A0A1B1YU27_9GAMM|nr:undecaprenyldiphospho-muramoylpentapeptide beta-N-acetylglucosaminyltransferase [Immundisolibacter cernigliae]ANX04242.1 UDP-N-acetylglucosamine--N-acetylmuramyl-(pentapeptide) pyrophosphoryl-undecaprenol N-acetylglucosamine transferase [Immundisolibacter cernigliae]
MQVLIMAGGTGGHVMPALAVAHELRTQGHDVRWLGTATGLEARAVPAAGIELFTLPVAGLRGTGVLRYLSAPVGLLRSLAQAMGLLRRLRPDAVLGLGGYASGPGGVAAFLLRRPLLIHEQNARPGLTNRLLARLAQRVLAGFPGLRLAGRPAEFTGNPVRAELLDLPPPGERLSTAPRLLVLGGSQGAQAINAVVPQALELLKQSGVPLPQVRHQAGRQHAEAVTADYRARSLTATVDGFIDDMAAAYGAADLAICRAGALTVAELCAVGLGALLVPFPHAADDHQTANARHLAGAGAAVLLPQADLTPLRLAELLGSLLADPARRLAMAEAARRLARPDAARRVAAACLEVAHA